MAVYVISEPEGSLVKIGYAKEVRPRVRNIMTMSPVPLVLRGHWSGDRTDERSLHQLFADRRRHGEWFDFKADDPVALISHELGREPLPAVDVTSCRRQSPPRLKYDPDYIEPGFYPGVYIYPNLPPPGTDWSTVTVVY